LRRELAGIVGLWARDREIRHTLAVAAQRSLDDATALDLLLRSRAWAVGVQDLPASFRQAIETRLLESSDPLVRLDAAMALGYAEEPGSSQQVRALILNPKVQPEAVYFLLYRQFGDPVTRPAAWNWLNEQQAAVAARLPEWFGPQFLAQLGESFCSAEERDAFRAALGPRIATVAELALRRAVERIDVCTAIRAARETEFTAMRSAPN
jgi:hypothetical protein